MRQLTSRGESRTSTRWIPCAFAVLTILLLGSCDDNDEDSSPAAPTAASPTSPAPLPLASPDVPTRFDIDGHWEGLTNQGRRIAFDVSPAAVLTGGRINLDHDCSTGELRMTLDGYQSRVNASTFSATMHWRIDDKGRIYSGEVTMSGRFESGRFARGGFVNSVTEKPADDGLGTCPSIFGTWDGFKE